nr:PAS domain S-box protein [Ardenticatena sp.]
MRPLRKQSGFTFPPSFRRVIIGIGVSAFMLLLHIAANMLEALGFAMGPTAIFLAMFEYLALIIALGTLFILYRFALAPLIALSDYVQNLETTPTSSFDVPAAREITQLADAIQRTHNQLVAQMYEIEAYRHIVEHLPLGILRLDSNGRILSANATLFALLGIDPKTWLSGRSLADFWQDTAAFETWWHSIKTTTEPTTSSPITWRRADGTPLHVRLDIQSIFDAQGTMVECLCIVTDITAILEAEERLRAAEHRYRTLLESASEGICSVDPNGRICYANTALANLLGIPREELIGRSWQTLCFEEDIPRAYQVWQNTPNAAEFRLRRADGTARWVFVSVAELPPLPGYEERWIVLITDIQAQKEAEATLQQSEAYFRALVQHSRDSILVLDSQLRVRFMSDAGFQFSGYAPEEVLGQSVETLLVPEDRAHVRERLNEALQSPQRAVSTVVRYRRRDGTVRTLACVATNLLDNPIVQGLVINAHDIHDYVMMQQEWERALQNNALSDRRLEDHLFAMAAEFLTPLRHIENHLNTLQEDASLSAAHRSTVEQTLATTQRLQTLVQKMVHSALIVTQETPLTPVDLNALIQTVLDAVASLIQAHRTTIIVDELPHVRGNPAQLSLLFQALLEYGIQQNTTATPIIRISAEREENAWKIAIHHTGRRLAPESLAHLFSLFPSEETERAPGTQLGFVSCRYIVEQHGGRIWAHTHPERGTTFFVTLPPVSSSKTQHVPHPDGR